jgi:hypothetical protein
MATRRAWPAADGGRLAQQTRLAGHDDNNDMDEPNIPSREKLKNVRVSSIGIGLEYGRH